MTNPFMTDAVNPVRNVQAANVLYYLTRHGETETPVLEKECKIGHSSLFNVLEMLVKQERIQVVGSRPFKKVGVVRNYAIAPRGFTGLYFDLVLSGGERGRSEETDPEDNSGFDLVKKLDYLVNNLDEILGRQPELLPWTAKQVPILRQTDALCFLNHFAEYECERRYFGQEVSDPLDGRPAEVINETLNYLSMLWFYTQYPGYIESAEFLNYVVWRTDVEPAFVERQTGELAKMSAAGAKFDRYVNAIPNLEKRIKNEIADGIQDAFENARELMEVCKAIRTTTRKSARKAGAPSQ